jgi:hypothetical protein
MFTLNRLMLNSRQLMNTFCLVMQNSSSLMHNSMLEVNTWNSLMQCLNSLMQNSCSVKPYLIFMMYYLSILCIVKLFNDIRIILN